MALIGLTGGIGSGKSTVSRRFASHGAIIVDADAVAREVVEPGTPALSAIVSAFGPAILHTDDSLNRAALGDIVFNDPDALQVLNSIVHPAVRSRTQELISEAPAGSIVIYDVPLLVETENSYDFDAIIVTTAPEHVRVERLMENRGMLESEARARIESQAPEADRLRIAHHVIDTSGSLDETYQQVDALWEVLTNVE